MIQQNELRKSNLVLYNGEVREVASINSDDTIRLWQDKPAVYTIGCLMLSEVSGIELTEEWIVKLAFIKDNGSWYKLPLPELWGGQITYIVTEGKIFGLICENEQSFGCKEVAELYNELKEEFDYIPRTSDIWINNIKYVHQLQNLYHSITGQELTIK